MKQLVYMQAVIAALFLAFMPVAQAADEADSTTEQIIQLDINSANAESIVNALDGIGMVKAREIVAYREMFGDFHTVEELAEVRGVGIATVEKNRHKIVIVSD
ncbi:MAG: helix-hairpin-helix domain-containing protein [Gammaproteobacteria bacterium]|nr:helix-hairpin-helix domain-containing protein [Gammaproteobacteria bacterium]MDD9959987.1 helix-hairpin-helix domain-containing protein [Gammaproteobacteria bacterium]